MSDAFHEFQLQSLRRVMRGGGMPEDVAPARSALGRGLSELTPVSRDSAIRYLRGSQLAEDIVLGRQAINTVLQGNLGPRGL